jgi:hypothetical protein
MVETPAYEELCKIKHVTSHPIDSVQDCSLQTKSTDSSPESIFEDAPSLQVSNTDQLSWYRALIMVLEMSTSSLSFRSSELSQHI